MGGLVSAIAFPAPKLARQAYEKLEKRPELVWLATQFGEPIPALYLEPTAISPGAGYVLLYSHGNAEDLGLHMPFIDALAKATGARVFSYEYIGYSLSRFSGGVPSEEACYRSIETAWNYLVDRVDPAKIIVYGRSIGTGPTVDLAARVGDAIAGVFLQSPLESAIRAALGYVSSHTMYPIDIFRNYEKMHKIQCPVAICHGMTDVVVPCDGGKNLLAAAPHPFPPCWLDNYGHNDMPYSKVFAYLNAFLASLPSASSR
ncbi:hypothetical protein CTAYLR_000655 [Chrysophaeum taylorii]|uniref:AB hydrolase-1 domain-containing protein n=1 Tax=Chrysophaeum taylorii TaxID=2483200 RepID=A0AAD7UAU5_9STRA|nr:hypothetical protein CTAYLR_000655 [Chrysophaeum taylorii]